jgi:SAM-dependent methyltransferase
MNEEDNVLVDYWEKAVPWRFGGERRSYEEKRRLRYGLQDYMSDAIPFGMYGGRRVLEVGSGSGIDSAEFGRNGAEIVSLDFTRNGARSTRDTLREAGVSSNVIRASAESLPFRDNVFDCVYSFGVLHHIPETGRPVNEIKRVLQGGGLFICMLYNKDSLLYVYSILFLHRDEGLSEGELVSRYSERIEGCPYTKTYSRGEIKELLRDDFREIRTEVHYNVIDTPTRRKVKIQLPDTYELGWHIIVRATKRGSSQSAVISTREPEHQSGRLLETVSSLGILDSQSNGRLSLLSSAPGSSRSESGSTGKISISDRAHSVDTERTQITVKSVYDFCPPTQTYYASDNARDEYKEKWGRQLEELGVRPLDFQGLRVLDAGCGSCEKTTFYHEWGARVTGFDVSDTVLKIAKKVVGTRDIELVQASISSFKTDEKFDLVISDGVIHCTDDTFAALRALITHLEPGGHIIFSLVNVWGRFWWFPAARFVVQLFGGSDFHRRALLGKRLFRWTRRSQEGTSGTSRIFRSEDSWAYDWFANPRWNLHSPSEIKNWLVALGLEHTKSTSSISNMERPRNPLARVFKRFFGGQSWMLGFYWLINLEPNMVYVHAVKR